MALFVVDLDTTETAVGVRGSFSRICWGGATPLQPAVFIVGSLNPDPVSGPPVPKSVCHFTGSGRSGHRIKCIRSYPKGVLERKTSEKSYAADALMVGATSGKNK